MSARSLLRRLMPRQSPRGISTEPVELRPDALALLASMYAGEPQLGLEGMAHAMDGVTRLARPRGELLYRLRREVQADLSVEIGLAYGFSTVFLLSALREQGDGHHIAIDPFQSSSWHGIGAAVAERLGMSDRFTLLEQPSELALPKLIAEGRKADLVFIDGDHRFDGAFVDFTLADRLLPRNGVVCLDDLWMPALRRVASFIERNRSDYERLPSPVESAAVFRKVADRDERAWDHYVDF